MGYEEVRHTADVAIRVWGGSVEELLTSAAQGLFAMMAEACTTDSERTVELSADDLETLLVDWLNELIYLSDSHDEAYSEYALRVTPGWHLQASLRGGPICRRTGIVKAATYHGLAVEQEQGQYRATVVFDT
ncbi:MAG: archease [Anaerolineae bacterium]|jgi:SHS2 domain-containing protein